MHALRISPRALTRAFSTTPRTNVARMTIVGRLAAEPELVTTSSGQDLVRYAVGTSHGTPDNQTTSWWKVASFAQDGSKQREHLLGLPKGTLVYVEGEASMRKYESDGRTETALSLVQNKLEVLKRPQASPAEASGGEQA